MALLFIIIVAAHTYFCCILMTTEADLAPVKCNLVLSVESFLFFVAFPHLGEGPTVAYINSHRSLSLRVSSFNALVC